jgi:serine/threonine protein kinase
MEPQNCRFWLAVTRCNLIDEETLRRFWESIPPEKRTLDGVDRRMARAAVQAGKLTIWQAQQILAGRWMGLRIGKYVLLDLIGQGGMGRVYLARDTRLHRPVAIKILSRERMSNPRALARFRREAKVGAQLQHENLVRIYDEGEALGVHYLVMEYIEGKNVARLVSEMVRIPPPAAADIARQVALGLQHLHEKGLLHRDVNPMNILVDNHGTAKLTDLGLAIDLEDAEDQVTRDGATVGTFDYISPEQARHPRSIDIRADIYSLGCTLYHMIAGHVPFPVPTLAEKLYAQQTMQPEPLQHQVPEVSRELDEIVQKMMRKLPEERYAQPRDVARALEPHAQRLGEVASASTIDQPAAEMDLFSSTPAPAQEKAPPGDSQLVAAVVEEGAGSGAESERSGAGAGADDSDPLDFISRIDFGLEPGLGSNTTTSGQEWKRPELPKIPRPVVLGIAGVLGVLLLATGLVILLRSGGDDRTGSAGKTQGVPAVSGSQRTASPGGLGSEKERPFLVYYHQDQTEQSEATIEDAIRRAMGRLAEIRVRGKGRIIIPRMSGAQRITRDLTMRAAEGAAPTLVLSMDGTHPWLLVSGNARLTLSNLDIVAESAAETRASGVPSSLIEADGSVLIQRCTFTARGKAPLQHVLMAGGRSTEITGCWFRGFDQPLRFDAFPDTTRVIRDCLFVRDRTSEAQSSWAVRLSPKTRPGTAGRPRSLVMERSTFVGLGAMLLDPVVPGAPFEIVLQSSAVRSPRLIGWGGTMREMDALLKWQGLSNRYEISGERWVTIPSAKQDAANPEPANLPTFAQGARSEQKSEAVAIPFFSPRLDESSEAGDFRMMQEPGDRIGIDPSQVGAPRGDEIGSSASSATTLR